MRPAFLAVLLCGSAITLAGVLYAILGFDHVNMPLLIASLIVGGSIEALGVILSVVAQKRAAAASAADGDHTGAGR